MGERTLTDITLMDPRLPGTNRTDESDLIRHGKDPALAKGAAGRIARRFLSGERLDDRPGDRASVLVENEVATRTLLRLASGG